MTFFITRLGDAPPRGRSPRDTRGAGPARVYQSMWFKTYDHPEFKFYDEIFYLDYKYKGRSRKKKFLKRLILKPTIVLVYWFMDDGHSYQNGRRRAYRFSTNSFHPNPVRVYFLSFRAYPLEDK